MDTARRLALRLHALHKDDRAWLLRQIDGQPQQRLSVLLDEIDDIGLVPDPELLEFATGDKVGNTDTEVAMRIGMASGETAFQALRNEPAAIRRYLLQVQQWPWAKDWNQEQTLFIFGGNDVARRPLSLTPRARHALLASFAARLSETELPAGRLILAPRPTFLQRIRRAGKWLP